MQLWAERGFERGIEETTAKELAEAAGVTKATFYLHFAHKEDILLEMGWAAAEDLHRRARQAMGKGIPVDRVILGIQRSLSRQIEATDRAAVARSIAEFKRRLLAEGEDTAGHLRYAAVYEELLVYGQDRGELRPSVDSEQLAQMLEAVSMDAVERWTRKEIRSLRATLVDRAQFLLQIA